MPMYALPPRSYGPSYNVRMPTRSSSDLSLSSIRTALKNRRHSRQSSVSSTSDSVRSYSPSDSSASGRTSPATTAEGYGSDKGSQFALDRRASVASAASSDMAEVDEEEPVEDALATARPKRASWSASFLPRNMSFSSLKSGTTSRPVPVRRATTSTAPAPASATSLSYAAKREARRQTQHRVRWSIDMEQASAEVETEHRLRMGGVAF